MMKHIRNRHLFISDTFLLIFASYLCFVVRFDTFLLHTSSYYKGMILFAMLMVPMTLLIFHLVGIYVSVHWVRAIPNAWERKRLACPDADAPPISIPPPAGGMTGGRLNDYPFFDKNEKKVLQ
jgi:hypothetical protein